MLSYSLSHRCVSHFQMEVIHLAEKSLTIKTKRRHSVLSSLQIIIWAGLLTESCFLLVTMLRVTDHERREFKLLCRLSIAT